MSFLKSCLTRPLLAVALCAVMAPAAAHADSYCQKGASVEMRWTGEWQPRVVEGGPNDYGQCQLSGDGNPPQWVSRDRIRPVGGGTFTDHVAPVAPVVDSGSAIVAPDMTEINPVVDENAVDPVTGKRPVPKTKNFGELTLGVYVCTDETLSFGLIDNREYKPFGNTDNGRYFYNDGTGILEMTSGGARGRKYRRNTDRTFRVVGDDTQDCVYRAGKDPRGGKW